MTLLRKYYSPGVEGGGIPDEDIIRKHVKAYYYHKDRQLNDDDILPLKRVRAIVNEINHTHSKEIARLQSSLAASERFRVMDAANAIDDQNAMRERYEKELARLKEDNERLRGEGWISVEDRLPDIEKDGEKVLLYRVVNDSQKGLQITVYDTFLVKHCDKTSYWRQMPTSPTKK